MNLSSILVFTSTDKLIELSTELQNLPNIEVHYQCHDTGRIVLIQEADNEQAEIDGLQRIKDLPQVMAAEMFYHYVDDGNTLPAEVQNRETASWA